jgi:hypothetical protein
MSPNSAAQSSPAFLQAQREFLSCVHVRLQPARDRSLFRQSIFEIRRKLRSVRSTDVPEDRLQFRENANVLAIGIVEKFHIDGPLLTSAAAISP